MSILVEGWRSGTLYQVISHISEFCGYKIWHFSWAILAPTQGGLAVPKPLRMSARTLKWMCKCCGRSRRALWWRTPINLGSMWGDPCAGDTAIEAALDCITMSLNNKMRAAGYPKYMHIQDNMCVFCKKCRNSLTYNKNENKSAKSIIG